MELRTVMLGIEAVVLLKEKNKSNKDTNRKQHPLSSRLLREKLFEVEEDEVGEHPPSDDGWWQYY